MNTHMNHLVPQNLDKPLQVMIRFGFKELITSSHYVYISFQDCRKQARLWNAIGIGVVLLYYCLIAIDALSRASRYTTAPTTCANAPRF